MYLSPLLLFLLLLLPLTTAQRFKEVTEEIGIEKQTNQQKWGGPCIADLDNDGIYDIIFSHHFSFPVQIYWGQPNGRFKKDPFLFQSDVHGVNVGFRTARTQERLLAINVGGARGVLLKPPQMFLVTPERKITDITKKFGLGVGVGRGRVSLFMDLTFKNKSQRIKAYGGPDLAVVGFVDNDDGILQHGYKNFRGFYSIRKVPGFETEMEDRSDVLDIDNDRRMEIISYPALQIYELTKPFTFRDVTAEYIPPLFRYTARTTAAIAEFDFNNDGKFDLYLARSLKADLLPLSTPGLPFFDVLFKNNGARLVDVSNSARIPNDTRSVGVTSSDFDNNGYLDLFVSTFDKPGFFLMNNGDETFTRVNGIIPKDPGVPGDNAVAVDYDQDGRVDLIVGQGTRDGLGPFRVMRNVLPKSNNRHYLHVRVGHHPRRIATALHAVVTVRVGRMRMIRRIGSPGTQGGGPSLLDTVHFGLGSFDKVDLVRVRWIAGSSRVLRNVPADQKVTFGRII